MNCLFCNQPLIGKYCVKFCTKTCSVKFNNSKRAKTFATCVNCHKDFSIYPCQVKGARKCCSMECRKANNVKLKSIPASKELIPRSEFSLKCEKINIKHTSLLNFEQGLLKNRSVIYKILKERDGNKCSRCGISQWNNQFIRLWVDHIDGNPTNNMPQNFRLICSNCDSQSPTYSNRNKGSGRISRGLKPYG